MKMRKMFYFYISMDTRVKIDCFLNNIVVIAQEILVLSENCVWTTAPLFGFTQGAFSQSKNFEKWHQFMNIEKSNHCFNIYRRDL